jgi:hypothetical protein
MLAVFLMSEDCVTVLMVLNRVIKSGDNKYENKNVDKYQDKNPAPIHSNGISRSLFRLRLSTMKKIRPYRTTCQRAGLLAFHRKSVVRRLEVLP